MFTSLQMTGRTGFAGSAMAGALSLLAALASAGDARADTVVYSCQDGSGFNAKFDNAADTLTLEFTNGFTVVLNPAVSGSGFRYTGGGYELHGKGAQANVIQPGKPAQSCQEIGRIQAPQATPPAQQPARRANPSFNCNARLNATEARICANSTLADLDRKMADTYVWLQGQLPAARRGELKRDQSRWLRQRNACGSNDTCIEGQIAERTGYLNEYIGPGEAQQPAQTGAVSFPFPAKSWGGIVRSGPGQRFRKIASLREGEPITVLEQTAEYFQDRPWFKIRYRGRVGYHWGGIICPKGRAVQGTFQVCN